MVGMVTTPARMIPRAHCLGHHRIERHQGAPPDHRGGEEEQVAERYRTECLGREPAHHDRVHDPHEHEAQLHDHDRHGQPVEGTEFLGGGEHMRPVRFERTTLSLEG
jgi:hypothetical protein